MVSLFTKATRKAACEQAPKWRGVKIKKNSPSETTRAWPEKKRRGACSLSLDVAHSPTCNYPPRRVGRGGRGGVGVSPRKYVVQSACQYDATSRVSDFLKWRAQCSSNWRIKISIWSRKYCSDFLELEILTSLLSWKARLKYFFGMKCPAVQWILKIPFYRRANFTGNHTDRSLFWGPVHSKIEEFRHSNRRFIKGCIILYIVRIFSSSELVEPHIIPLKVRLAVALKEEAKWQVFVRDCEHWILLLYRILILYWAYTCNSVIKSRKPIKGFV